MTVTEQDIRDIQEKLKPLLGRKAWKVWRGWGSFVTLEFGEPVTTDGGYIHGEWHIWVKHAVWRLDVDNTVLAASEDPREELAEAVKSMENKALLSVEVTLPALDTMMVFEDAVVLRLFPIYSGGDWVHWMLFTPDRMVLCIGPGSTWAYKRADEPDE